MSPSLFFTLALIAGAGLFGLGGSIFVGVLRSPALLLPGMIGLAAILGAALVLADIVIASESATTGGGRNRVWTGASDHWTCAVAPLPYCPPRR